jgi:hypothetical protein
LGSSTRDKRVETEFFGEEVVIERRGTNGDAAAMRRLYQELDGKVDAFGFGGYDLGLTVNGRYYPFHSVHGLVEGLQTPVVDGGAVQAVIERRTAKSMTDLLPQAPSPKRALITVGVARYGLTRGFVDEGYEMLFGDLGFGLGLPVAIRSLETIHALARILLPVMGRLPFQWLYPAGDKQTQIVPKFPDWYAWATVIGGDFLYIKQHLPARLDGKIIVTNTTTAEDVDLLRERGVAALVTTTPRLDGRSFGTNVIEAVLTALAGKGRPLTQQEVAEMAGKEDLLPSVKVF